MPIETDSQEWRKNVINSIIRFLRDNEEYGDDWGTEIKVLKSLIEKEG